MVTVKIGPYSRDFESVDRVEESWVNRQINGLRGDKQPVCVRVTIQEGSLNITLATPDCAASGGGSRPPNSDERRVFELWEDNRLNRPDFQGGNLISFFKKVRKIIG